MPKDALLEVGKALAPVDQIPSCTRRVIKDVYHSVTLSVTLSGEATRSGEIVDAGQPTASAKKRDISIEVRMGTFLKRLDIKLKNGCTRGIFGVSCFL